MQHARRIRQKQADASWTYIQSVLTTIGNITILWASAELMLSHLVLWHLVKEGHRPKQGYPRMLAYQLDYLKDFIEKDASLSAEIRAKLADIRLRLNTLNEFRISIIHGVMHQRNRRTTDWHTHSIKIDGFSWKNINYSYSNEELQRKSREISDLTHEMSPLIAGIVGIPHPANSA